MADMLQATDKRSAEQAQAAKEMTAAAMNKTTEAADDMTNAIHELVRDEKEMHRAVRDNLQAVRDVAPAPGSAAPASVAPVARVSWWERIAPDLERPSAAQWLGILFLVQFVLAQIVFVFFSSVPSVELLVHVEKQIAISLYLIFSFGLNKLWQDQDEAQAEEGHGRVTPSPELMNPSPARTA